MRYPNLSGIGRDARAPIALGFRERPLGRRGYGTMQRWGALR